MSNTTGRVQTREKRELRALAEGIVRPLRASTARKRRMREELLAHLAAIFDEELEKSGDQRAALEGAAKRFGDPGELSRQLQETVPRCDRWRSILERLGYQRGESVWHLAGRHLLVTLAIYAAAVLLALPILAALLPAASATGEAPRYVDLVLGVVLVAALLSSVFSLLLAALPGKIVQLLYRTRAGRLPLSVLCALVSLLVFPLFPAASMIFLLMARQATEQWRCQQEWA